MCEDRRVTQSIMKNVDNLTKKGILIAGAAATLFLAIAANSNCFDHCGDGNNKPKKPK